MNDTTVGIAGLGVYIPDKWMTAGEVSRATGGYWTEEAIKEKLGFDKKPVPGDDDGTCKMGARAALASIENSGIKAEEIDLIISIGEEWKEYPLTTSGIYIQKEIGADNAWAFDMAQRCCSCVSAMKIAKDMMIADDSLNTVLIAGGYRNGDFVDYAEKDMSMMFNLGAAGGALILKKGMKENLLLGTHLITDGSMAWDAGVKYGGCAEPITKDNFDKAYKSLMIFDSEHMKNRLNEISMPNWIKCMDEAFRKSRLKREDMGYLAVLHFKYSMHKYLIELLGLKEDQTTYLRDYGHLGQIDQILSLKLGLERGKIKDGTVISMIAAGIGYAWAANVIKWGK
ncbi:MAG: 3-oxoacyl-ACP synthase [Candidatus Omnitrophota bacterium]